MTQNLQQFRADALAIFQAGVNRVLPENCIPRSMSLEGQNLVINGSPYILENFSRIFVVAFGKAALGMFQSCYKLLGDRIHRAIVITNVLPNQVSPSGDHISYYEGSHPIPDEHNISAVEAVIDLCHSATDRDLFLFLISGGGSALLFAPPPHIPVDEYRSLIDELMKKGASINELNDIRIVLSRVKGGQLLHNLDNATVINLIISDVIGDPPEYIASGPTVLTERDYPDQQIMQAKSILEKYQVYQKYSGWLSKAFEKKEKPSEYELVPDTHFIGTNRLALLTAKKKALDRGYNTLLLSTMVEGESRKVGHLLGTILLETILSGNPVEPPCCILSGGETTVTVTGEGIGGRNQELALGAADILREAESGLLLSAGTDGIDGPTNAAGAIVDSTTAFRAVRQGISIKDALHENNSYHFFKALDDLVITGPTGTNVMDIQVGIVG